MKTFEVSSFREFVLVLLVNASLRRAFSRIRAYHRAHALRHIALLLFCAVGAVGLALIFWRCLPSPLFDASFSTVIVDHEGKLLGASIAADEQWRFPPRQAIPAKIRDAMICYEDKRFFRHHGVDPLAFMRAVGQNLRARGVVSGASTITMQVIRLMRQRPRTFREKLIEMAMALRLEIAFSKNDILALYASHAPFGGNVVGIDAASWRYFGREPEKLSWAESAMLAVLPNSPALVHPGKNRTRLLRKRNALLETLRETGVIDATACRLAQAEPLPPAPHPIPMLAPHVLANLRQSQQKTRRAGQIVTTLDRQRQLRAIDILNRHAQRLSANGVHNAAALILDVNTGHVLAYVGNVHDFRSDEHGNYVDVITAPRSTGSTLKPFLYAGMLHAGELLPTQLIADIPTRFGSFSPENFSKSYQGAVPAYMALARSLNIPAVRLLSAYSVDRFSMLLKQLGMTTLRRPAHQYGLSLILGGAEGSLWELTGMYASMARTLNNAASGMPGKPAFFAPTYLADAERRPSAGRNPFDAAACWLTFEAMQEVTRPGVEIGWKAFESSARIAWKTGTSYGYRDAWALGVTPQYAVGVWVGNADGEGRPNLTGIEAAAPILFEMFGMLEPQGWFVEPTAELVEIEVCAKSGYRAGPHCEDTKKIKAPRSALHSGACPYCQRIHCDAARTWRVHSNCEQTSAMTTLSWFVLPPAIEWFYKQGHSDYRPLPPYRADCLATLADVNALAMTLLYPPRNGKIYVPLELDGQRGRTVFEAAHRDPGKRIFWHLDGEYLGETRAIHQMSLAPAPGQHTLTLVDEDGEFLQRVFTVLEK